MRTLPAFEVRQGSLYWFRALAPVWHALSPGRGRAMTVSISSIHDFRGALRGQVLCPGDPGYDTARRIYNAMIDRRPALIARCACAADVVASVHFARAEGLEVSVRGGGHNVSGKAVADGALMIDLAPM